MPSETISRLRRKSANLTANIRKDPSKALPDHPVGLFSEGHGSLTYGVGIREEDGFVSLLNSWMGQNYRIEFINLGIPGSQSEDVLGNIKKFTPLLKPNLIVYAVCINDFLPSGRGEYYLHYAFPLPDSIKQFFTDHTYSGAFLNDAYDVVLRKLHLRVDFFDDVLTDFDGYQRRFWRDVAEMNALVRSAGLPSMAALVLDQSPQYGGKGYRISRIAEEALRGADATVIPMENYYRRYNNKAMYVSRWEGHPDEVANYIWATMLLRSLEKQSDLQQFKR